MSFEEVVANHCGMAPLHLLGDAELDLYRDEILRADDDVKIAIHHHGCPGSATSAIGVFVDVHANLRCC
ncbi:hypothetical protein RGCCGE502_21455 [Rhizobium grahamii CCGE 502]|uniref:Uncharacterized protein n=1 Tax=Rhizobium grahamii CCGE 502 TaxID=990285 RepID=S3HBW9_9HYPH|nr:hypothetical protein RGCCGE502_21455 [Rhizobium grahamii CCGE 502]